MFEFDSTPTASVSPLARFEALACALESCRPCPLDDSHVAALEAVTTPVMVHDGERTVFANAAMLRLLGHSLDELRRLPHYAWVSDESVEPVRLYGERTLAATEIPPALECHALTASGSVRHLEVAARRVALPMGPVAVVCCLDLSDMQHVQTSLFEVGRVLHQILDSSPIAIFVIDQFHRVTHWNDNCAQLTGQSAQRMVGSTEAWRAFGSEPRPLLVDLIVDGSIEAEGAALYGAAMRPSPLAPGAYELEDFFPQFGAQGRRVFCTAAPLYDTQGKIVGAIETLMDVTRRHEAEAEIKRHEQELEQLVAARTDQLRSSLSDLDAFLENSPVGILCTQERRILRHNRRFMQLFGVDPAHPKEGLTKHFQLNGEAYQAVRKASAEAFARRQSLMYEAELKTNAGEARWVQTIVYPSRPGQADSPIWWLLQDHTEMMNAQRDLIQNYQQIQQAKAKLEEAQNQLLQSEKMASIGQLAAGVAHEINNPVGFVASNLSTLGRYVESLLELSNLYEAVDLKTVAPPLSAQIQQARAKEDIEFIREDLPVLIKESGEGLTRVKKIVQDLKDFSRVDQSDWQEADLNQGLQSTLNMVWHDIRYKVEVVREFGNLPPVRCLAAQLNQVFMNLIVNAAHAIKEKGILTLRTRHDGDQVCVSVQDNGCGMSPDVMKRIFDPFYTTKPVGQGTGLGLSVSFSIVNKHGGRLEVQSEPGVGTTFEVWLPLNGGGEAPAE
ncbi:ATP-binding protein [Roseateles sp.]|uniref:ATP-binding protein n=1 Tax=Roseateles sp. TaxID=1971397 RepID=UPI003BA6EF96